MTLTAEEIDRQLQSAAVPWALSSVAAQAKRVPELEAEVARLTAERATQQREVFIANSTASERLGELMLIREENELLEAEMKRLHDAVLAVKLDCVRPSHTGGGYPFGGAIHWMPCGACAPCRLRVLVPGAIDAALAAVGMKVGE